MPEAPTWTFEAVDVNGTPLTEAGIVDHEATEVAVQGVGNPDLVSFAVPLDSETAYAVIAPDVPNDRDVYIKGYRSPTGGELDRTLEFYGPVRVNQVIGAQKRLAIVAAGPDVILTQRPTAAQFPPTDLGLLIAAMVDQTNLEDGETGILTSALWIAASSMIDVDSRQNRPMISAMIQQFAGMLDGVECWTVPMELAAGKIAELHAAPRRGVVTDVVFAFGDETESNCVDMGRVQDDSKIVNDARGYTDLGLTSQKVNTASVAAIRRLIEYYSYTGETSQAALDARTQGRLDERSTRDAVSQYTAVPTLDAPRLYDDFNIGDTVGLYFREGAAEWDVRQRVRTAKLAIDTNGLETPAGLEFRNEAA